MYDKSQSEALNELDPPEGVAGAEQAVELLRVWIADGAMTLSLNADAFGDQSRDWGRLLGEIAHHVARAAELHGHMSEAEALAAVRSGFNSASDAPRPIMTGRVRGRVQH